LFQPYKTGRPPHPVTLLCDTITSRQPTKRATPEVSATAAKGRRKRNLPTVQEEVEQLATYGEICNYWAVNPAFDPQRVLLRRLLFINGENNKYGSVGFYPARDYQPLVEFGTIRRCGSKSIILTDEQVFTLAECLP